ncbi:maltase 2-like [Contarinia nasturtii]|uniref:maltase 2-like n=1 Tax=Contarinia nasturtii TaxID=265458 RepID=UPI0012D42A00|nr:maltase 2-like [Contarinia nasturtii]
MQTFHCICIVLLCVAAISAYPQPNKTIDSNLDWWKNGVFYQIYPRSFKDSNGDGIGDIRGIIQELDYLKDLGIAGAWLSPIFKSPMVDFGYDVEDFYEIDPIFGTMADLEELFREAAKRNLKIFLDFVPNHVSDRHEWFKKSVKREGKYENYYIWADGKNNNTSPPNNWVSIFYGPAWKYNEERNQWYYHCFAPEQPELNLRNEDVLKDLYDVLIFWLEKGASGFRMDALNFLIEFEDLRDEPLSGSTTDPNSFWYTTHEYTLNLHENFDIVYKFRDVVDKYQNEHPEKELVLMGEAYSNDTDFVKFYGGSKGEKGLQIPFNFVLISSMKRYSSAKSVKTVIDNRLNIIPSGKIPNWQMGNHDHPRIGSRYPERRVDGFNALVLTLPGVAVTYYGEEIGMIDNRNISFSETADPQVTVLDPTSNWMERSRDPARTPLQWDATKFAGFMPQNATAKPWLPIHVNYKELNVAAQKKNPRSTLNFYKRLVELRKEDAFAAGSFNSTVLNENVFAYVREFEGSDTYWVLINFGDRAEKIDMTQSNLGTNFPEEFELAAVSPDSCHEQGAKLKATKVVLGKYDAIILKSAISSS